MEWTGIAAACLFVGIAVGVLGANRGSQPGYGAEDIVTGSNELVTLTLTDGTIVRLGPDSRLAFPSEYGPRAVFLEGQAYFAVRPGSDDPFQVYAEGGEVRVLGTRFDVRARERQVRVVVLQGTVEIGAAGETVSIGRNEVGQVEGTGDLSVQSATNLYEAISWVGDFVVFESSSLEDVRREFDQRFGVRIQIVDRELDGRAVTGWFHDDSPLDMLASICLAVDAVCTVQGDTVQMELGDTSR